MKKAAALVLALIMILSLAACGGATTTAATTKAAGTTSAATTAAATTAAATTAAGAKWSYSTPMNVAFSQNKLSVAFRVAGVDQLKAYVKEKGLNWTITVTDGNNDATKQTADIEDLISKKVDAIICCPVTADTMTTAAAAVTKAKIPLVLVNRKVSSNDYTVAITGSNYMIGQQVANDMAKRLNNKGKVALMEGTLGASDTTDRTKGFLETIAKYPDIKVVAQASGNYVKDKGNAVMEDFLTKNPDLQAVFCENDEMAQGALLAADAAKKTVLIYGNDCYKSTLDLIKAGRIAGTTVYPTSVQAAVDTLIKIFENGGVYTGPKEIIQDVPLATKDNVDSFYKLALNA